MIMSGLKDCHETHEHEEFDELDEFFVTDCRLSQY